MLPYLNPATVQVKYHYYYLHFVDDKTEALEAPPLRAGAELRFSSRCLSVCLSVSKVPLFLPAVLDLMSISPHLENSMREQHLKDHLFKKYL